MVLPCRELQAPNAFHTIRNIISSLYLVPFDALYTVWCEGEVTDFLQLRTNVTIGFLSSFQRAHREVAP